LGSATSRNLSFNFTWKETTMNRFTALVAIFTLALIQQIAHAGVPADAPPTLIVRYADLDLDHTPGAMVMYRRLKHAAEQVCYSLRGRDLESKGLFGQCMEESVASSITKINRPVLTQYYSSIIGGRSKSVLLAAK
jgi:UrcA family protein